MWHNFDSVSPYQVQYKRGHDERVSTFTPVADTPELLRAKAGGQLQNDVRNDGGGPGRWISGHLTHKHQDKSLDSPQPLQTADKCAALPAVPELGRQRQQMLGQAG